MTSTPHWHEFLRGRRLTPLMNESEAEIRANPQQAKPRWRLFQLLCLLGDWTRALKQLPLAAEAMATTPDGRERVAERYRQLIVAEQRREEVFAGRCAPSFLHDAPPWAVGLLEALALEGAQQQEAADERREAALSQAPFLAGQTPKGAFSFFSDADSRLGPTLEWIDQGVYHWLPMEGIQSFFIPIPERVIDLIWTPVSILFKNKQVRQGDLPVRYPLTRDAEAGGPVLADALLLGNETLWQEQGRSGTFGSGQKMWMYETPAGQASEWALRDIRECHFAAPEGESAANDTQENA